MAVVGEAHIIVRALTDRVASDIQKGFSGTGAAGRKAGEAMGKSFTQGFNSNANANVFTRFADGIRSMVPDAEAARLAFRNLARTGYTLQAALGVILGAISSLIGGLGAVAGSALGAAGSLAALGTIFASLGLAMISARLALSGVGKALAALNKQAGGGGNAAASAAADAAARAAAAERIADAERNLAQVIEDNRQNLIDANNDVRDSQIALNKAIKDGQEQIQQLGFDAEEAALAEGRAALELDKARETLARTQDLPPNSRARKEAELAFQEAELRLRQAKDRSADLNKEQDRLARTGVAGTEAVISANQRLAQSEANKAKTVRDAARRQADAERELAKARAAALTAGTDGGGGGGTNPFAGLNAAQIEFVKNLQTLKPLLDEIKLSVSNALLPNLWVAVNTVAQGLFTTVRDGLTQVATATGLAAVDFANMVTEGRNVAALNQLFTNSATIIRQLGTAAGAAYGIALSLLNAAAPQAERFVSFLNTRLLSFDEYLKSDAGLAATQRFFTLAGDAAAQFGRIIGNVLGGIGGIIMANLGPGTGGQIVLDWLEQATAKFRDLKTAGVEGVGSLSDYFVAVATNATKILSSVGALIGEILKLGANESIGQTFDILKQGAPFIGNILTAAVEAGPVLAELIVNIAKIASALADTGALQVFFGTLNTIAGAVANFLGNDVVKSILDVTGRIFAFTLALGSIGQIGGFAFKVVAGNLSALSGGIGSVVGGVGDVVKSFTKLTGESGKVAQAFAQMTYSNNGFVSALGKAGGGLMTFGKSVGSFLLSPAGIVIGIIALIVGALITLYNTSDTFRAQMDAIFTQLGAMFSTVGQQIMDAIMPLVPVLLGAFQQIVSGLAPLLPLLAGAFMQIIQAIIPLVTTIISQLVPAFLQIVTALMPLVTMLISTLVPVIIQVINAFLPLVTMIIESLVPVITMLVNAFVPLITTIIDALIPVITMIIDAILPVVTTIVDLLMPVIQFLADLFANVLVVAINIIVGVIQGLGAVFTWLYENIVKPVFDGIAAVFTWIWENILKPWFDFMTLYFEALGAMFTWIYENIVKPIFDGIAAVFTWIWENIIKPWFDAIGAAFKVLGDVFNWIYNNIVKPIFDAIGAVFTFIWNFILKPWFDMFGLAFKGLGIIFEWLYNNIVKPVFDNVGRAFDFIWNNIIKPTFNWIGDAIKTAGAVFKWLYENAIKPAFDNIGIVFNFIWKNIIEPTFKWIGDAVENIGRTFTNVFQGIGNFVRDTFNNVVGFVKGPINEIISLINGMINGLNRIKINVPDWVPVLGGKTIGFSIPNIPQLALGGIALPTDGGTLAQLAEAGKPERIEPLDANGMSKRDRYMIDLIKAQSGGAATINITVNPSAGMDESELAAAISREITFQMRRGAVA